MFHKRSGMLVKIILVKYSKKLTYQRIWMMLREPTEECSLCIGPHRIQHTSHSLSGTLKEFVRLSTFGKHLPMQVLVSEICFGGMQLKQLDGPLPLHVRQDEWQATLWKFKYLHRQPQLTLASIGSWVIIFSDWTGTWCTWAGWYILILILVSISQAIIYYHTFQSS